MAKGVYLHKKHTQAHNDAIGLALQGRPVSAETRAKIGNANRGRKFSPEVCYSFGNGNRGVVWTEERKAEHSIIMSNPRFREVNGWKGDDVGYGALHEWVVRELGKPKECEECGLNDKERVYHWANISRNYKRELTDWIRLCVPCHKLYDLHKLEIHHG